jgi:hypothetical protein
VLSSGTRGAKQPANELCEALVSHVFLHTFFGLTQFCKKPCNPVFNVHQFFKKAQNVLSMFSVANFGMIIPETFPQGLNPGPSLAKLSAFH